MNRLNPTQDKLNYVIIGNPENRRVAMFQEALAHWQQPLATIVPYLDLLKGKIKLAQVIKPNSILKIDSPGENFLVEQALLELGSDVEEPLKNACFARLTKKQVRRLDFDNGLIIYPHQWYLGYLQLLKTVSSDLAQCENYWLMNWPDDILLMFDKISCHNFLLTNKIAVPPCLGKISCFDELQSKMKKNDWHRVFIKLSNGSSASGVVAYQTNGKDHIAITSTKMVKQNNVLKLYNSLKLSTYTNLKEIKELVDALCKHCVHVEKWLPKAGYQDRIFDLRVLVIGKKVAQVVMRTSKTPITNLHLLNQRGNLEELKAKIGSIIWGQAMNLCEDVMRKFPKSLYAGIDLMFLSSFKEQSVLEVNAFGDLLPNVLHNQLNSYETEVLEILKVYDKC